MEIPQQLEAFLQTFASGSRHSVPNCSRCFTLTGHIRKGQRKRKEILHISNTASRSGAGVVTMGTDADTPADTGALQS